MMLSRNGYPQALTWEDDALARLADFLKRIDDSSAPGFRWPTGTNDNDSNAPWLINALLRTSYPTVAAGGTRASRNYANADWWAAVLYPECSDGLDNDGDTVIDFPADSDCKSAADNLEAPRFRQVGFVADAEAGALP